MAVLLLVKSDPRRYANLLTNVENQYIRGQDGYPSTLSSSYDMLVNYKSPYSTTRPPYQDAGVAFTQIDGNGSHAKQGRGFGRGNASGTPHGGRGQGHAQPEDDNASGPNSATPTVTLNTSVTTLIGASRGVSSRWLLLDSCSSGNLIRDPRLLHDIHLAECPITIHCNAGNITINQKGYFGSYPVGRSDIRAAANIFGPNIGCLKGKKIT